MQKIKKAVENLYNDNNKLDEEISLVNTVLMNKYSNFLYDNVNNSDNSGVNIFNDKNFETKIAENINKEEDVFGADEII